MNETHSKNRQRAEAQFSSIQTVFFAKNDTKGEVNSEAQAREAKTLRLREARLARELADQKPDSVRSALKV